MLNFIGTCVSADIAKIAEKHGRPSSYKNACRQIKRDYPKLYEELALNLYNPWENETNIKKIGNERILHIVYSAIDYLFIIE